jgi:DNA-binding NarL/FixJ family response regulator
MSGGIRVLVADDERLIRAGIRMILDAEPDIDVVAEADNGQEVLDRLLIEAVDVVIMDLRMPVLGGVEAAQHILSDNMEDASRGAVAVLVLTTFDTDDHIYAALRAGAAGYVLKEAGPAELVTAIRAVAAGDAWLYPPVARRLVHEFASRPERHAPSPAQLDRLTNREREVLVLMAHGFSNAEIAEHLFVNETTVKTHVTRVRMKLALRDRAQAVVAAYQSGLVRPTDHPPGGGSQKR